MEKIDDPRERAALESQISEFGQCPSLLFRGPHPRRDAPPSIPILLAPLVAQPRVSLGRELERGAYDESPDRRGSYRGVEAGGSGGGGGGAWEAGDHFRGSPGKPRLLSSEVSSRAEPHMSGGGNGSRKQLGHAGHHEHHHHVQEARVRPPGGVPFQAGGGQQPGRSPQVMDATQGLRRAGSGSPPRAYQSSSIGLMGGSLSSNVGSSVGALWKRGLAMATAVSAAAEAGAARGGLGGMEAWRSSARRMSVPLEEEEDREELGWQILGERQLGRGQGFHGASLPPPPSASVRSVCESGAAGRALGMFAASCSRVLGHLTEERAEILDA